MARGIYKIINVVNNKFYVGSAVDLKRRKTRHFSELRTGKHNNRYLQSSWDKYGEIGRASCRERVCLYV